MDRKPTGCGAPQTYQCTICVLCRHLCTLAAAAASIRASLAARGHQTLSKVKSVYQILSCSQLILSGLQLFSCIEGSKLVAAHILCRTAERQATHPEAVACHAMFKHALSKGHAALVCHQLQRQSMQTIRARLVQLNDVYHVDMVEQHLSKVMWQQCNPIWANSSFRAKPHTFARHSYMFQQRPIGSNRRLEVTCERQVVQHKTVWPFGAS